MADNILVTQGSGTAVAADDVGSVLYQRVKIAWGVDGSAVDASTSNPFPVNVTNASIPVTGAFWQATQPVSVASLPLPAGAATAAKQPALGTAGTASADVVTVQGIASMTALKVDGSGVTQPVSGTITANAGSGTFAISAASLPLPSGASTSANQTTLNTAIGSTSDAAVANGAAGSIASYLRTIKDAATDTTTASPVKVDQTTPGTTNATSIAYVGSTAVATGNGVVGAGVQRVAIASDNSAVPVSIQTPADVITFTPTLDTAAYAAGDVLSTTAVISNVMRVNDGRANLLSVTGIDKSKQKPAMTMLFYQTNVTSAAANAANNLSDADQINLLGYVRIAASDWIDYANNSICCFKGNTGPNLLLEAASGTKDVYVVTILDAGTPTFAVGDLVFKLGVVQS